MEIGPLNVYESMESLKSRKSSIEISWRSEQSSNTCFKPLSCKKNIVFSSNSRLSVANCRKQWYENEAQFVMNTQSNTVEEVVAEL